MTTTAARLLRLLSLLQSRTDWTGPALAARLEVTTRTIRNDVNRLRDLGYPVHAAPGVAGGYRLGAGTTLPPLLLDDEEAVAVAASLRTAAGGGIAGAEETAARALAKLEQVLPARLRHRVDALRQATVTVPAPAGGPAVDPAVLATVAAACRDRQRLRFDYRGHDGTVSVRDAEPHRLVATGRRWYLVAWDTGRADWRTFRVDRVAPRVPGGPRFAPRPLPGGGDVAAHVMRGVVEGLWRVRGTVRLHAPAEAVADRVPPAAGLEAVDGRTCLLHVGADTFAMLAHHLGLLDVDFEVVGPPELAGHVRRLAARYARAAP